jgi:hypothetical protein
VGPGQRESLGARCNRDTTRAMTHAVQSGHDASDDAGGQHEFPVVVGRKPHVVMMSMRGYRTSGLCRLRIQEGSPSCSRLEFWLTTSHSLSAVTEYRAQSLPEVVCFFFISYFVCVCVKAVG